LLERLEQPQAPGWRRYAEAESRLRALGLLGGDRCFSCTAEGRRPAAAVWLQPRGEGELFVSNVVPLERRELSDAEYHLILGEFASQLLRAASSGLDVQTELTHRRVTLEAQLSHEGARRLKAFSETANRALLHQEDRRRWRDFIVQAHVEGADFDSPLLERWLADQGWPQEQRQHLVEEYETSRSVLAAYDEERVEKCLP
jgi:hypothetical protein